MEVSKKKKKHAIAVTAVTLAVANGEWVKFIGDKN